MESRKKRRTYDEEFKKEAVRLVLEDGYSAAGVDRNLGTGVNIVSRWVRQLKQDPEHAFPGKGKLKAPKGEQSCKNVARYSLTRWVIFHVLLFFSVIR